MSESMPTPFECYLNAWRRYVDFNGRSRRREYWFFVLFNVLISIGLGIIDGIFGLGNMEMGVGLLSSLYGLAVLLPSLGYAVRRCHDIGRSGLWLLLLVIPFLGPLIILVFMLMDSEPGSNDYGPNPKGEEAVEEV